MPLGFVTKQSILMNIAPNLTKSKLIETKYPELSKDIKFEEIRAQKGLQIVLSRSDQKSRKRQNSQTWCNNERLYDGVLEYHHIATCRYRILSTLDLHAKP